MLDYYTVDEIRAGAQGLENGPLWDWVGAVRGALIKAGVTVSYASIWSALYGRSKYKLASVPPLTDPFPDIEDWGEWFDALMEKFRYVNEKARYVIRGLRIKRALAEEQVDASIFRDSRPTDGRR